MPKKIKYARTIMGTPRITSTKIVEMMLHTRLLSTLNRPKIRPRIHAKNRPHSASNSVCPIASSSSVP